MLLISTNFKISNLINIIFGSTEPPSGEDEVPGGFGGIARHCSSGERLNVPFGCWLLWRCCRCWRRPYIQAMEDAGHQDEPNCLGCNYDGHSTQKQPPGNHQVVLLDVVPSRCWWLQWGMMLNDTLQRMKPLLQIRHDGIYRDQFQQILVQVCKWLKNLQFL